MNHGKTAVRNSTPSWHRSGLRIETKYPDLKKKCFPSKTNYYTILVPDLVKIWFRRQSVSEEIT
jgi:hypothetical protein